MNIREILFNIQQELKSSKNLFNEFAKFNYRNLEGILADLKPILAKYNCTITFNDKIVNVGAFNYIESTATLTNKEGETISVTSFAREDENKAGMSAGQMTGCSSSYSRKYALCGLCAINEEKDLDSMDNTPKQAKTPQKDDLAWTDEPPTKGNFVGVIAKTPIQEFNEWYETAEKTPQVQKFYAYWKDRVENWRGKFNLSQLIEKYCN